MMKWKLFGALLAALIYLSSCGIDNEYLQAQSPSPDAVTEKGQLFIEGLVELKRKGSSRYQRVSLGAEFRRGDLLKVAPSAIATVVCPDATVYKANSGVSGLRCKPLSRGSLEIPVEGFRVKVVPPRGDESFGVPIVLSPRRTKLLSTRPVLRWTAVTGASAYRITLRGKELHWSIDVGSDTEIPYPTDEEKQLTPGETYKLIVSVGDRDSDERSEPGAGFTLLTDEQASPIRDAEDKIRRLGLPEDATKLLTSQLYAASNLNAEAIELLRPLTKTSGSPAIARQLGNLYLAIGLFRPAEEQHLESIKFAEKAGDLFSQAAAWEALGEVYQSLGNVDEAIRCLLRAQREYQKLGEAAMVVKMKSAVAELRSR